MCGYLTPIPFVLLEGLAPPLLSKSDFKSDAAADYAIGA